MIMHLSFVTITLALSVSVTCQDVHVTISTSQILSVIDDHFVGVTLDSSLLPISANFSRLDLTSPKVLLLAKALSPSYIRVGGTLGDEIVFDPSGSRGYSPNITYTAAIWDRLNKFASSVGWDMVFGLNVLRRKGLEWDPENALELMSYTLQKNYSIAGFELGNEPQFFPGRPRGFIPGSQLGRDFMTLKHLVRSIGAFDNTLIIGCDSTGLTGGNSVVFKEFFDGIGTLAIERITIHQYYGYEGGATVEGCVSPELMDSLKNLLDGVYSVVKVTNPATPLWMGETSSFWGGGAAGISDRYVAGFLWLDKLGVAATMGVKAVLRQSFYGQNYSLIQIDTFEPNPDYWLTLLYKRLVGNTVLNVTSDGGSNLRLYAHCTNHKNPYGYPEGSVTIYYLNLHNDTETTTLRLTQFSSNTAMVFSLSPSTAGNLSDRMVALNGHTIEMDGNSLPDLQPVKQSGGSLITLPRTFGFIVIPDANFDLCKF